MNLFIINNYIKKLTKPDIQKFATTQGINLTDNELNTIYYYIKNKTIEFLKGTPEHQQKLLKEIKQQVKPTTSNKIEELYNTYKYKL